MKSSSDERDSKLFRGRLLVCLVTGICVLVLVCIWLAIPRHLEAAMSRAIHSSLPHLLGVQASVSSVDIDLLRREVGFYGFRISQPTRFGNGNLLYAPEIEAVIRLRPLLSGTLEIAKTRMPKIELDIRTDADGRNSLGCLSDSFRARMEKDAPTPDPLPGPMKSIRISSLSAKEGVAFFRDGMETNQRMEIAIADIHVNASNLRWGCQSVIGADQPGIVTATGRLRQRPFHDGRCGIVLKIGATDGEAPALNSRWRFIGTELASFAPLLPGNTAAILGGDALDLSVDMTIVGESLNGQIVIETLAGYRYNAMLSGTPGEPVFTTDSDALAYVLSRTRGGAANFLRNLRWAGKGAGGAVADAATDLARGTIKTVGSFGQGLLQTARGIVTLDSTDIGRGAKAMGTALAGGATDAVFGAGGEIIAGAGKISHSLTGGEAACRWRNAIPYRWTNAWHEAIEPIEHAPSQSERGSKEELI